MVRKLLVVISFLTLFARGADFWNQNNVCFWEGNCLKHKTKVPKVVKEIERIDKEGDRYLNGLSASQIRRLLKEVQDYAVMHPTEKNLEAYTKLLDFVRRKSLQFMYAFTAFINSHPDYNVQKNVGTTTWSYRYILVAKEHYVEEYLKRNAGNIGMYFVCDANYPVCFEAAKAVKNLVSKGIPVVTVAVHCSSEFPNCVENLRAFKHLGRYVPSYYLFYRGKKVKVVPIGQGLITSDRLIFLLYRYAIYEKTGRWVDFSQIPLTKLKRD
jgi:hypothetical protein